MSTSTIRTLESPADHVPSLTLPACALHPGKEKAAHNLDGPASTITRVEQQIRVLLAKHGANANAKIEQFTREKWEDEASYFRAGPEWEHWKDAVGPYETDRITDLQDQESTIESNRKRWLLDDVPSQIDSHLEKARSIQQAHGSGDYGFRGAIVTDGRDHAQYVQDRGLDPADLWEDDVVPERDLDNEVVPSDIGIDLPAPLPVGTFPSSSGGDSTYCLLPYCGTVVCGGPYFHTRGHSILCKHLVYALLESAQRSTRNIGLLPLPEGVDLPVRARQLVSSEALHRHVPGRY
jgi:hypothetical protein